MDMRAFSSDVASDPITSTTWAAPRSIFASSSVSASAAAMPTLRVAMTTGIDDCGEHRYPASVAARAAVSAMNTPAPFCGRSSWMGAPAGTVAGEVFPILSAAFRAFREILALPLTLPVPAVPAVSVLAAPVFAAPVSAAPVPASSAPPAPAIPVPAGTGRAVDDCAVACVRAADDTLAGTVCADAVVALRRRRSRSSMRRSSWATACSIAPSIEFGEPFGWISSVRYRSASHPSSHGYMRAAPPNTDPVRPRASVSLYVSAVGTTTTSALAPSRRLSSSASTGGLACRCGTETTTVMRLRCDRRRYEARSLTSQSSRSVTADSLGNCMMALSNRVDRCRMVIRSLIQRYNGQGKGVGEGVRASAHMHNVRDGSRQGMGECGLPTAAPRRAARSPRP